METEEKNKLTRQELYNLVWSTPLTQLAKKYHISDNGFRKICKKLDVPLPKNGYWAKLKFKKKVKKIPFKINTSVDQYINLSYRNNEATIEEHYLSTFHRLKKELEAIPKLNFKVPEKLTNPDKLIIEAKSNLNRKDEYDYRYPKNIVGTKSGYLYIAVAKTNIPRALRFMDTFIKLIKKRGHQIQVSNGTHIIIGDESISIRFREIYKRIIINDRAWGNTELVPSGILSFKMDGYNEKEWRDAIKYPLETKLSSILAKLELEAQRLKEWHIQIEQHHKERERLKQIEEQQQRRLQREHNDFKNVLHASKRWNKAMELRNYLSAVEQHAIKNNTLTASLQSEIQWAREKADWYDPLIQKEDELLNDRTLYD